MELHKPEEGWLLWLLLRRKSTTLSWAIAYICWTTLLGGWSWWQEVCTVRPGAPRRALTVWDAISDLPPIPSGHDTIVSRHNQQPLTHLQRLYRADDSPTVEDHISKDVNSLCLERISRIPKTPGSDWRDLPNISTVCEDGRVAKKLRYPYTMKDGSKGVCSCNVAHERRRNYCLWSGW